MSTKDTNNTINQQDPGDEQTQAVTILQFETFASREELGLLSDKNIQPFLDHKLLGISSKMSGDTAKLIQINPGYLKIEVRLSMNDWAHLNEKKV